MVFGSRTNSHERIAKRVVENENPTQHPGSGEGGTGCISMRGERANESRKTILFAFRKDLPSLFHLRSGGVPV